MALKVTKTNKDPEEQVLVIPRRLLDGIGPFQGLCFDTARYLPSIFAPRWARASGSLFLPRSDVESDPAYKQLIPYVILVHPSGYIYSYLRLGGESRLNLKRSIGVGGHINPQDAGLSSPRWHAYYRALCREVAEETAITDGHLSPPLALVNDDTTDVGRVHLGIVHLWRVPSPIPPDLTFASIAFLAECRTLEPWSQMCFDHLSKLISHERNSAISPYFSEGKT